MDAEFEKRVGVKIRDFRVGQKMTQEQLAAKLQVNGCDITRGALSKIEAGLRHLYVDELKQMKEILGVTYEDLLN